MPHPVISYATASNYHWHATSSQDAIPTDVPRSHARVPILDRHDVQSHVKQPHFGRHRALALSKRLFGDSW